MRLAACLGAVLLVLAGPAAAEQRLALVIGNADYATLAPLQNPVNDATDVAAALEGLGFEVMFGADLDRTAMINLVSRYIRAARQADVSLFYYAGHGFQVDDRNFLVPVDAAFRAREDIADRTIELTEITRALEGGDGIHLVFLDACRENPLRALPGQAAESVENGLARIGDAAGFLFAFATQPGNVAYDGVGRNSFFAQALLSHIHTPGQDIASMMIAVRRDVLAATGGRQVPWENSSLTRQFVFAGGAATASLETMLWQVAASARDLDLMNIYLTRYPEGAHVGDVRDFLTREGEGDLQPRSGPAIPEDALWDLARRTRERSLVEIYLDQNPAGRHALEARRLLGALPRADEIAASPGLLCERLATHPRDATANTAGVPLGQLAQNATAALDACSRAVEEYPDMPHFTALLARVHAAAGRRAEAARLYLDAAERGDLRAMVSLGLMLETGDGAPRDLAGAIVYYQRAAAGGSPDGAINLAVALITGTGAPRDVPRAMALLADASEAGSAIATYNLGVLTQDGATGTPDQALAHFRRAAELGEPRAYVAAGILYDEGRGIDRDPEAAAEMLLLGVASDYGEALAELTLRARTWSTDTIVAVQRRLHGAGLYDGALDGVSGPRMADALWQWRAGGWLAADR